MDTSLTGTPAQVAVALLLAAALDPTTGPDEATYAEVRDMGPRDRRDSGVLTTVHLDNRHSGFAARDARVYLPPAYFARPRPELPVVVAIAGVPGSPSQWFDEGLAGEALDAFAAEHGGRAPVVVAVDANGETFRDTLCVDSPGAGPKVATYLTRDVPASVTALFDVARDPAKWAIAGLSRGGSCAVQTSVAHPGAYPTFLAMSPQKRIVDDGRFIAGLDDEEDRDAARALADAANRAGLPTSYSELPGGHTWKVWSAGFRDSLPWLSARLGLTGED